MSSSANFCLTPDELESLTLAWDVWVGEAQSAKRKITRMRLHLHFLLARFGGLRGAEIKMFSPACLDPDSGRLAIAGNFPRHVYLPFIALRSLRRILSLPEASAPDFTSIDPGFIRRTFAIIAERARLEPGLGSPRALRYARGLELYQLRMSQSQLAAYLGLRKNECLALLERYDRMRCLERVNIFFATLEGAISGRQAIRMDLATASGLRLAAICDTYAYLELEPKPGDILKVHVDPGFVFPATRPVSVANIWAATIDAISLDEVESGITYKLENGDFLVGRQTNQEMFFVNDRVCACACGRALSVSKI